jgi:serine protease AprX
VRPAILNPASRLPRAGRATGTLAASWARSSWSCATCGSSGSAIDPTRSSWSRSSWSSFGDGVDDSAAQAAAESHWPAAQATATPDAGAAP